jgi:hypothetical protein
MPPIKVELPASTPRDLCDEFSDVLRQLGPVHEPGAESYSIVETILLILAAISATADLLAIGGLLIEWRDKARRRGVPLDRVRITAGDQSIDLKNTDTQTLVRVLQGLRDRT